MSDTDKENLNQIINTVLPLAIDLIVSASLGAFNLNSIKDKLTKLFACNSCICKKTV